MLTEHLTAWLTAHRRAWDGWPTMNCPSSASPIAEDLYVVLAARLRKSSFPYQINPAIVAWVGDVIAVLRMASRSTYRERVTRVM